MTKLKAREKNKVPRSSSDELERSELERSEQVECPAFGHGIKRQKCLEYQAIGDNASLISSLHLKMWKTCRSGCPNSLIGPDGRALEQDELEPVQPDNGFAIRLKSLIKEQYQNNEALFARETGLSPSGLRRYLAGGDPTRAKLIAMAKAARVNLLWLATGEGPKQLVDPLREDGVQIPKNGEYALIPLYDVTVSAGGGAFNEEENILMRVPFLRKWLRKVGLHEKDLALVRAHGDSMLGTINDDDLLLVDRNQRKPSNGHIYIMCVQGVLIVKRLQMLPTGEVMVLSDNKHYPDTQASLDQLDIGGRVVWKLGML